MPVIGRKVQYLRIPFVKCFDVDVDSSIAFIGYDGIIFTASHKPNVTSLLTTT